MAQDGFVIVDKPGGLTSHDVVARMRRIAHTRRVGHAGTLDPMATGVLVIGVERATRLLPYAAGHDKAYRATIRLGQATVTDDAEGEVTDITPAGHLADEQIMAALGAFRGAIMQVPSAVSAIKIKGVRSYARVRRGEEVALAARPVTVHSLELVGISRTTADVIDVDIEMECSPGTYVRAVARDLGVALRVGGHLTALRRTAIGAFTLADATPLAQLMDAQAPPPTLPLAEVAARLLPRHEVDEDQARVLSHGGPLPPAGIDGPYAVFGPDGAVIAVVSDRDGRGRADVVLAPAGSTAIEGPDLCAEE